MSFDDIVQVQGKNEIRWHGWVGYVGLERIF